MSKDEALGRIIINHCKSQGISISEFARKANISKSYISRIVNNELGKYGVSSTIKDMIATVLDLNSIELEQLIENYQENIIDYELPSKKSEYLKDINKILSNYSTDDLKSILEIISKVNTKNLISIKKLLEDMK